MPTLLVSGWLLRQMELFGLVLAKQVKLKYLVYLLWLDDLPMIFHIMLESLHIWLTLWPQFLTTPPSLKPSATCFLFSPNLVKLFGNWLWSGEGHWNHFYSIWWHLRGGWVGSTWQVRQVCLLQNPPGTHKFSSSLDLHSLDGHHAVVYDCTEICTASDYVIRLGICWRFLWKELNWSQPILN